MWTSYDDAPPADDAGELAWVLFRQDQVIARRQALQFLSAKAFAPGWTPAAGGWPPRASI